MSGDPITWLALAALVLYVAWRLTRGRDLIGDEPREIPYPPVFRDWKPEARENRVTTGRTPGGPRIEMTLPGINYARPRPAVWMGVDLTEDSACLLAASLLQRAERDDLADYVLANLGTPS